MIYDLAIIVCGGRDYTDVRTLRATLDKLRATAPVMLLIHGAARGADSIAGRWAADNCWCEAYPADWDTYGKAAGPTRNRVMLARLVEVQAKRKGVVAAPGGAGTADMCAAAEDVGVRIMRIAERARRSA